MTANNFTLVESTIPLHLRDDSPLFSEFLKVYYEYATKRDNAIGLIKNAPANRDIDTTSDSLLNSFYSTYAQYLPKEMRYDQRNMIKLLNEVYAAKGTENALRILFRTIFGQEIEITYPSENILRASDSTWVQKSFITLVTEFGFIPHAGEYILVDDTTILIDSIEVVDNVNSSVVVYGEFNYFNDDYQDRGSDEISIYGDGQTIRIYFSPNQIYNFTLNSVFKVYRDGILYYTGSLRESPSKLKIINPGKYWMPGQVISIPGTAKNSLAKITKTDEFGRILSIQILEFGFTHDNGQLFTISSYPAKPPGGYFDISEPVPDGLGFLRTISIVDFIDRPNDKIIGDSLSDGRVIDVETKTPVYVDISGDLSIEEWMESRATLEYQTGLIGRTNGYFSNERGQVSNSSVKLQDNYFYQQFSYQIESSKNLYEYKQLLNITHPAGTKRFSLLSKSFSYKFDYSHSRDMSHIAMYKRDVIDTSDGITDKQVLKPIFDSFDLISSQAITLNKGTFYDSTSITHTGEYTSGIETYAAADYFAETYTSDKIVLNIT